MGQEYKNNIRIKRQKATQRDLLFFCCLVHSCTNRAAYFLTKEVNKDEKNRIKRALQDDRRQCDLLWKRQITTLDELLTYKENLQAEYSTLTAQRRALYRGKSKTTPADYSEQIQALTARIRELRREITTCADIEMDCEMVQDKVQRAAHRRENPPRERIHRRAY